MLWFIKNQYPEGESTSWIFSLSKIWDVHFIHNWKAKFCSKNFYKLKEKSRKVGSHSEYWFFMDYNMISREYSFVEQRPNEILLLHMVVVWGLGGLFAINVIQGLYVPVPEMRPWKPSLEWRAFDVHIAEVMQIWKTFPFTNSN